MIQGTKLLIFVIALVQGIYSTTNECRDALAPPSKPRGVNQVDRLSGTPLFELHVTPINDPRNGRGVTAYKVSISIEEGKPFRFSEATLAVKTNGTCGTGDFEFNPKDFLDVMQEQGENCPQLIQTNRKTHMTELSPLTWVPPSCGCVHFRILIVESGEVYYAENEGVAVGPLAKEICLHRQQETIRNTKISREQRLESLCHVIDKHSSGEIMSRREFLKRRQLETKLMDRLGIEMALELRRHDVKACCHMERLESKMKCFDDARRRRIDQFCASGVSKIPFRSFRKNHMKNLEQSCCFVLGEHRYKCFAKNSELELEKEEQATLFDYSMDASDVVNDLADFGSREHLDEFLRPRQFYGNDDDEDNDDDEEDEDDDDEWNGDDDEVIDDDSEEDDFVDKRSKKKSFLQRTSPKYAGHKLTSATKDTRKPVPDLPYPYATTMATKRDRLSNEERRRVMRKQFRQRSSMERRRLSKAERRAGSRERRKNQRASLERREKLKKSRYEDAFRGQSSEERRMYYNTRIDNARRKGSGRSREVKGRGHTDRRQPMIAENDFLLSKAKEDDIEDQGGSSMDKTLKKIQKRIRRLKLRNMCCKAGVEVGGQVYGRIGQVNDECRHGSMKFVRGLDLSSGFRKCAGQFIDCCLEEAKKGVPMTSQEFLDNTMKYYWENNQRFDPRLMGSVLAQRKRQPQYLGRDPYTNTRGQSSKTPTTSNVRHDGFDKRLPASQQPKSSVPSDTYEKQHARATKTETASLPKATPSTLPTRRNPTLDNSNNTAQDNKTTRLTKTDKGLKTMITNSPSRRTTTIQPNVTPSKNGENIIPSSPVERRVIYVEVEKPPVAEPEKTKIGMTDGSRGRGSKTSRKNMSREDIDDSYHSREIEDIDTGDEFDEREFVDNQRERKVVNTNALSSRKELTEKTVQEKQNSEAEIKDDKFIEVAHHQKTKTNVDNFSQSKNIRTPVQNTPIVTNARAIPNVDGEEDRTTKQIKQRRRERQRSHRQKSKRKRNNFRSANGFGALDSREMAERNARHFANALDSREMADQYRSNNRNKFHLDSRNYFTPSRKRFRGGARRRLFW